MVDALGNPLRIHITAGNVNDIVPACDLIEGLLAEKLLADRAYDANKLLALAERQNHEVVIPPTTRYDKLAITFKASVMLASCLIWLQ